MGRRGWWAVCACVVLLTLVVTAGVYAHLRGVPIPDENDGAWVFDHEEELYATDRNGSDVSIGHKRFHKNKSGEITLEVHEIFGKIVVKIWQSPHGRIVALLDDDNKWRRAYAKDPEINTIRERGEIVAVRFILWDVVGRRLVGRQSH